MSVGSKRVSNTEMLIHFRPAAAGLLRKLWRAGGATCLSDYGAATKNAEMTRHDCGGWRGYTDIFIGKHRKCLEPSAYELLRRDRWVSVEALWETAKVETTLRNARDAGKRWSASPSPRKSRRPRNNLFERRATRSEARACYRFTFAVIDRTLNYDPAQLECTWSEEQQYR
jgi:hypothetical protein